MNYQIITDEEKLLEFIDWLPELKPNEKFYCSLFARKKYCKGEMKSSDQFQLSRFVSNKTKLLQNIKKLEVTVGTYQLKNISAPQESLAFYINPNPRDLQKAIYDGIIRLTELLKKGKLILNHIEMINCIHKSVNKKVYLDFDVDEPNFDLQQLKDIINASCLKVLRTRGGFHVLVKLSEVEAQYKKSFYQKFTALGVDQLGDIMLPVAGCTQGGFTPRFIEAF